MLNGLIQGGFDRRDFLRLAAAGVPAALATTSLGAVAATAATTPKSGAFDPQSPEDNLRAYIRMTRSLDPAATTVGWFGGRIFSVIGDSEIIKPLFDIEGFGIGRTLPQLSLIHIWTTSTAAERTAPRSCVAGSRWGRRGRSSHPP